MFNPDASSQAIRKKLPKSVVIMIEKGNLVMAIKTLAADEGISMDAAKARIDEYEAALKTKQHQQLTSIASKQGIPNSAISSDREVANEDTAPLQKQRVKSTPPEAGFKSLQRGVDSKLDYIGYKKPLLPYWAKRLLIIAVVMLGLFWILWRIFG
ncbi:hypothetical protein ACS8FD_00200 [Psychrobacter sp. 1U2]|uniref:hypothetical protein n=1 Tax=Psychrobacter sp. 1U2 TaxID=3453577 RepID=UPI003F48F1B8